MKSKDERQADFERREAIRKAKYAERKAALREKADAATAARGVDVPAPQPGKRRYQPSTGALVMGALIPGLGQLQRAKLGKQYADDWKAKVEADKDDPTKA